MALSISSLADHKTATGYDLIINSTSAGFNQEELQLPENILTPESFLYDLSYSKDASVNTPFLEWGISNIFSVGRCATQNAHDKNQVALNEAII